MVFGHPGDEQRLEALHRHMSELAGNLPDRLGRRDLALRLDQASRWYVPPVWLLLGTIALAVRRPTGAIALSVPTVAGLLVDLVSALGLPAAPHYSVPTAPALVLLAAGVLFAERSRAAAQVAVPLAGWDPHPRLPA